MSEEAKEVWLSMGEAARQFGASSKTLKRLLDSEQVPVLHLNGNYRVLQSDVEKLKASRIKPMNSSKS